MYADSAARITQERALLAQQKNRGTVRTRPERVKRSSILSPIAHVLLLRHFAQISFAITFLSNVGVLCFAVGREAGEESAPDGVRNTHHVLLGLLGFWGSD